MSGQLLTERLGHTLVLTISNPGARNALGPTMYSAAVEALDSAARDPEVRVVVLTGEGNTFCAGGNLNRLLDNRSKEPSVQAASIEALHQWTEALRAFPKPVIAAVEGPAAGAGFSLVLACDLVVAASDAKFVMAYVRVGLTPDGGGSWHLARALPRALATEVLIEGKPIDAPRLAQFGLVNRVVPPGQARTEALAWAEDLAALAPNSVTRIKGLISHAEEAPLPTHLEKERDNFIGSLFHADGLEGISAFLEKRKPVYR
ncbi:enoyl-CoA hydratase [Imbroritus primus]|jgi:enoyl-CoA hydratase/carnithine racemase|uniref:Enoyl-CoA hydratase n=1 Tax=Imbroritus primus TaxID=3058603 RepID=A0ACD3SPJ4_9BURK|nr:enoyl-CoA hydratase [Burkholderiaceae bacterium PBA]